MNNLKKLRTEKGYTLKKVATENGLSESQLSFYENGKREPRDKKVWHDLANYYNASIAYVMGLTEDKTSAKDARDEFYSFIDTLPTPLETENQLSEEQNKKLDDLLQKTADIIANDKPLSPPAVINLNKVSDLTRFLIYDYARLNDENKKLAFDYVSNLLKNQKEKLKMNL